MILGTAGHIDHGKTALVKALTGVDTDRLPEEQRRGITIELGFAPLMLPGIGTIGVVDVPGHEAFVRTMLAGASGIDLALLVIAADEGVMPQTREHVAILELLGVHSGVVAITKTDLVDDDWMSLVREDVTALLASTSLRAASQIAVSAHTGAGLEDLRLALATAARALPARPADDLFRLPVDRAFSVRGAGTVVTGTAWTGRLRVDETVRILPGMRVARVRGLQHHGASVAESLPGSRLAINLSGVDVADVPRGSTLVAEPLWDAIDLIRADVTFLADAPSIGPRTRLRLHLGTRDVAARVIARAPQASAHASAAGPRASSTVPARIVLDEPIAARGGDRFVLRAGSPPITIGGGIVTDAAPGQRRVKPWPATGLPLTARLVAMAREADTHGVRVDGLPVRLGIRPSQAQSVLDACADSIDVVDGVIFDGEVGRTLERRAIDAVAAHHIRAPLEDGLSLQALRTSLHATPVLSTWIIDRLVRSRVLEVERGIVRRAGWKVQPSASDQSSLDAIATAVISAGREPPSIGELAASGPVGSSEGVATFLRLLERQGVVRQVEADRFYGTETLKVLAKALRDGMVSGREYGPAELREFLGVSRKYLIPLLEYYDRTGVTERRSGGRVVVNGR